MRFGKRLAGLFGVLITVTGTLAFGEDVVGLLFERALVCGPDDYGGVRGAIIDRGGEAVVVLQRRLSEASSWYERAIAGALILAIDRPEEYRKYQEEFDRWADTGVPPRQYDRDDKHSWRKSRIVSGDPNAVGFLIEKLFKEVPEKVPDDTVSGWHYSQPVETAAVFLQFVGGADAARAIGTFVLGVDDIRRDYQGRGYFFSSKRRGAEQFELSRLSDRELGMKMMELLKKKSFVPFAAWVLGDFRDARAIEPLIESLRDYNVNECSNSATALARIGDSAIPALIEALRSEKRQTRSWADVALGRMGVVAVPHLSKVLYEGPAVSHYHGVRALRAIGDRGAVPALIKVLESEDLYVVGEAARGLGEIGDEAAREPLLKALENRRNWHASGTAIFGITGALAAFEEPRAFGLLSELATDENWYLRRAGIGALAAVGGEKSLPVLLELIKHEHKSTRGDAVIALGKVGDSRATPALIEALSDPESFVRSWAAWSLGEIGDRRALSHLRRMTSFEEKHFQRTIDEAIRKIEGGG